MSKETLNFLRDNIKYGFTDERGPAWWANKSDGAYLADGSHFPGQVPEEEVRRLLDVELVEGPTTSVIVDTDGERIPVVADDMKSIIRVFRDANTGKATHGEIFKVFKEGYQIHGYNEWINKALADITDSGLQTACVALLRKGAVAFHQVKLPDTWEVAGFKFTPWFTGATSANGSLASIWFTGVDAACCDNTFEMAREGAQTRVSRKHTRNSPNRLGEVRSQLGLTLKAGEEFADLVEEFTKVDVSEADFRAWMDEMAPLPEKDPKSSTGGRSYTMKLNQREAYEQLWNHDPKVTPWAGTKFGILQLDNTYRTWERSVKGVDRIERHLVNLTIGAQAAEDRKALEALESVQSKKLVLV